MGRLSMILWATFDFLLPLFQNESWCTIFHIEMRFSCMFIVLEIELISKVVLKQGKSNSKIAYIRRKSLHCKLVPVQYREYKNVTVF